MSLATERLYLFIHPMLLFSAWLLWVVRHPPSDVAWIETVLLFISYILLIGPGNYDDSFIFLTYYPLWRSQFNETIAKRKILIKDIKISLLRVRCNSKRHLFQLERTGFMNSITENVCLQIIGIRMPLKKHI